MSNNNLRTRDLHPPMPKEWADLIEALTLLARGHQPDSGPLYCSHDQLTITADPACFTTTELARLETLGFIAGTPGTESGGTFYSFRFANP